VIGVETRVGQERREVTSEVDEVSTTSLRRIAILRSPTPSSQSRGHSSRSTMVNRDSTMKLPMFHGTDKNDVEQYWFTCEAIWSVKRIIDEASKIAQPETTFRDRALT
jgi:hypothetical protein